ncbi:MAG: WD40 repeat domain-containing protein, partial [Proteobacteria bacterium]|nr:WD40 repeat domain-containing protein [Pseudomonadota bacterium]
ASGLLWRGDALAEYRLWRARFPGLLTAQETAFAAASLGDAARTARRRTWSLAALLTVLAAGVVALVFLNARASSQRSRAEESQLVAERRASEARDATALLRAKVLAQYNDQGRRAVIGGEMFEGLTYLANAHALGAGGPAYELLVATASRVVQSRIRSVEHDNSITHAGFSPDGTRFVTGGYDNRARVWATDTGQLVAELRHAGPVVRAEFVGDAIVTASRDGTASLWDATSGVRRQVFDGGDDLVGVKVSPDHRWVVTVTANDLVKLWVADTGQLRAILHPRSATSATLVLNSPCAFSPDGALVAAGDHLGTLRVWQIATNKLVSTATGHTDQINVLQFSPDGRQLLSASSDHTAATWEVATGRRLQVFTHAKRINDAAYSPDGQQVATASNDFTAVVWDATTGARRFTLAGHTAGVNRVVFRGDGKQLATAADDSIGILWDAATGRRVARLIGHGGAVNDVSYSARGDRLVTASEDNTTILWKADPQEVSTHLVGHRGTVYSVDFSPDSTRVVTSGQDGTTRIWDRASGTEQLVLRQAGEVRRALFSPDGHLIATAGFDGAIRIWDARTGALAQLIPGHTDRILDLSWHPDGDHLVSASKDGTARVVSLTTPDVMTFRGHTGPLFTARFSSTGDAVVSTAEDNVTRSWDPKTGVERNHWADPNTMATASFDRSNQFLVGATFASVAKVWRVDNGEKVSELLGHAGTIMDTSWSPDGEFVTTASLDTTVRIWDVQRGETLAVFQNDDLVWSARYSHDGRFIATVGDDGRVTIWTLPPPAGPISELIRCYVPLVLKDNRMLRIPLPKCT